MQVPCVESRVVLDHYPIAVLTRYQLGWLAASENVIVRRHVSACPQCTVDCAMLRLAIDVVGVDALPPAWAQHGDGPRDRHRPDTA